MKLFVAHSIPGFVAAILLSGCVHNDMADARPRVVNAGGQQVAARHGRTQEVVNENEAASDRDRRARTSRVPTDRAHSGSPSASSQPSGYKDPGRPAMDIICIGFGQFEEVPQENRSVVQSLVFKGLAADDSQGRLISSVRAFFEQVAVQNPELRLRVSDVANRRILGETIENAAFAAIALNKAVLVKLSLQSGEVDNTLFLSMPLFLVSAKSYQVIHARPLFVRIPIPQGVSPEDPEICRRTLHAVQTFFGAAAKDPQALSGLADALRRGSFRDPNSLVYALDENSVSLSANAASAENGFSDADSARDLLRDAASFYLAFSEVVFPPIHARLSSKLYRDVGSSFYALEVLTDLSEKSGLPRSDSGRILLPIRRVDPDIKLSILVKTGVRQVESATHLGSGNCRVELAVTERNNRNELLKTHTLISDGSFVTHANQTGNRGEGCLLNALIEAAFKMKTGLGETLSSTQKP